MHEVYTLLLTPHPFCPVVGKLLSLTIYFQTEQIYEYHS